MKKRLYIALMVGSLLSTHLSTAQEKKIWTLRECIEHAIAHNINIKQKEIAKENEALALNNARLSRLPSVSANASYGFNFGRSLQSDNTYKRVNTQNLSTGISASLPLFTGFQISNEIAQAKYNLKAAVEDLNKAKEDIGVAVAQKFVEVLFAQELYATARRQLDLSKELEAAHAEKLALGKVAEAEHYEMKARTAQDTTNVVTARNNYQLALLELSQLLELASPDEMELSTDGIISEDYTASITSPQAIYNQSVWNRPDIRSTQYRLQGSEHAIKMARSGYYPTLQLGGGINSNYFKMSNVPNASFGKQMEDNFAQHIGVQLNIPIFDRFATRNRIRSAKLQQSALRLQLEETKKGLYKEIQTAYYSAIAAESKYKSSQTTMEAAEKSYQLMVEKMKYGKANVSQLNESNTAWQKATSDMLQAKYDYIFRTHILRFYAGEGVVWESTREQNKQ